MSEQIEESRSEATRNVDEQRAFFLWFKEMLAVIPKIQQDIADNQRDIKATQLQIVEIDKKHTASIDDLKKTFGSKLDHVVDTNNEQNKALANFDLTLSQIKPYIEYVAPISQKWRVWRPRVIWFGALSSLWVVISFFDPSVSPAALRLFIKALMG